MPIDLLQIALEHHRAGRLTQAETNYRAALAENPSDPEARHWLGVLLHQAGQFDAAIALLQQAAGAKPEDAAYQHNLGHAYRSAGRIDEAIDAFRRAAATDPGGREVAVSLAQALVSRNRAGDADAAVEMLRAARERYADSHEVAHQLGIALLTSGQHDEAIAVLRQALALRAADPRIYFHLGLAYRQAGEPKETRKWLIKALEIDPAMGVAWRGLAMLDAEAGQFSQAAGLFRRAIAANRDDAEAHEGLGKALAEMGKTSEAQAAFEQSRRLSDRGNEAPAPASVADLERHLTPTEDQAAAHFGLAVMMNVFPPPTIPSQSIVGLFDSYANRFDHHLQQNLNYHVPEQMIAAVAALWDGKPLDVLDLGCGTGLCGPLVRPMARTLAGVDLSPAMIEMARKREIYDRLDIGNLVDAMRQTTERYDLLLCTDVLIYVGDCAPVFESALRIMRSGAMLAFSAESGGGERFDLIPRTRRYTHSRPYIDRLASIYGFEKVHFSEIVTRKESDKPVPGYLVILRLPKG